MKIVSLFIFLILASSSVIAQSDYPNGKVWGNTFGDYFYKAGGDSTGTSLEYTRYNKDFNSFEFRRINIGYEYNFNETFSGVVSLAYDGEELTSDGKRSVYVRDAALKWKNIFTNSDLSAGILPTPGFTVISERFWGYRSVEKTIMDQRGFLGARDIGVMLNGVFDKEKKFGYYLMIGNGRGTRLENNKYKRFYGNLTFNTVSKNILFNFYADYEPSGPGQNRLTMESFIGFQTSKFSIGVEGFIQEQRSRIATDTVAFDSKVSPHGISSFLSGTLIENKLKGFFRYDYYNQDNGSNQQFVSAGLDFSPDKRVHIIPNLWLNMYGGNRKQLSDVVPRITFSFDTR